MFFPTLEVSASKTVTALFSCIFCMMSKRPALFDVKPFAVMPLQEKNIMSALNLLILEEVKFPVKSYV